MNIIIALQAKANQGKSTTISLLRPMMARLGYAEIFFQSHGKDFIAVFEHPVTKHRIGITSAGDTLDLVTKRLTELIAHGCSICVCAARTSGGTVEAIENLSGYAHMYVPKTSAVTEEEQDAANDHDAETLLREIEKRI
ncbi:MAG: hypothetical protein JSS75_05980 [Bacteroidetes bacterium]|nr:hypothetical protein [Bacteroidota bacterium]